MTDSSAIESGVSRARLNAVTFPTGPKPRSWGRDTTLSSRFGEPETVGNLTVAEYTTRPKDAVDYSRVPIYRVVDGDIEQFLTNRHGFEMPYPSTKSDMDGWLLATHPTVSKAGGVNGKLLRIVHEHIVDGGSYDPRQFGLFGTYFGPAVITTPDQTYLAGPKRIPRKPELSVGSRFVYRTLPIQTADGMVETGIDGHRVREAVKRLQRILPERITAVTTTYQTHCEQENGVDDLSFSIAGEKTNCQMDIEAVSTMATIEQPSQDYASIYRIHPGTADTVQDILPDGGLEPVGTTILGEPLAGYNLEYESERVLGGADKKPTWTPVTVSRENGRLAVTHHEELAKQGNVLKQYPD